MLHDGTSKIVAGGNQHSKHWAESLTPEMAKKIAALVPGFPTKLEDFGDNGSSVWGMASYGSNYRKAMLFQLASSYCEVCHSFKFRLQEPERAYRSSRQAGRTVQIYDQKSISCEECHGAGAHLLGARGLGMPSKDARTGSVVTRQISQVKEISEKEYKARLAAPVAAPKPAPAPVAALTPTAAPVAAPSTAPSGT